MGFCEESMIVIWSKPKKFKLLSWIISKYMRTGYSHSAILINVSGEKVIFQATKKGVHALSLKKFLEHNEIVEAKQVTKKEIVHNAFKTAIEFLGVHYGVITLIAIAFKFKFYDGDKTMICSEFAARVLGVDPIKASRMTPLELSKLEI